MKNKRNVWMESLERRVMLSITDLYASFGSDGVVRPLPDSKDAPYIYATPSHDIVAVGGRTTEPQGYPIYDDPIADVSPSGQILWSNDITDGSSAYPLAPGPVTVLADGSAVLQVEQYYGNSGEDFFDKFDPSGNIVPSFTSNFGTLQGGADAQGGISFLLPLADGSFLTFYGNDSGVFRIQKVSSDGNVTATFASSSFSGNDQSTITAVTLQNDGKVVIAGYVFVGNAGQEEQVLALQRFNSDGTLDTTFGDGGSVVTDIQYQPDAIAEDANGNLVVAASAFEMPTEIIRFTSSGSLDSTFGNGGVVGGLSRISLSDLQIGTDNSVYAAGERKLQRYLLHLSATGSVLAAAVGSSEELPGFTYGNPIQTDAAGHLITINSNGVIQEGVGLSVSQPAGDTTLPTVTLGRLRRVPVNSPTYNIDVTYSDAGSGVDTQTIETGNLLLKVGPHQIYGRLVAQSSLGDGQVAAEYAFTAPSGEWNQNDIGMYTIETAADEVTDNAGNGVPLEVLGSFTIKAEKAAEAAAVVQMDMPMLAAADATPNWLKSDGEVL